MQMKARLVTLALSSALGVLATACAAGHGAGFSSNPSDASDGGSGTTDGGSGTSSPAGHPTATLAATRLIAPLSAARATTKRPTLRWKSDGIVTVEICSDRACTKPIGTPTDVSGTSFAPATDLPTGVSFWRLRTSTGDSPVWEVVVGAESAPVDTSWGTMLDVNGDGFADVVVGASGANATNGAAYVYLGSADGLATTPAATLTQSDGAYASFGFAVAGAGDVDGDGFGDVIIGAYYVNRAYLYKGGPAGLSTTPAQTWSSPTSSDAFGASVAGLGDVNGDGYADVAIGAPQGPSGPGAVHLYLGGPEGPKSAPDHTWTGTDAGIATNGSYFGQSIAGAGDIDGDGFADTIIGAPAATSSQGRAYLIRGGAAIASKPDATLSGAGSFQTFGSAVASAGDVNGDGYADVVVSSSASTADTGAVYVFMGSAQGLSTQPIEILDGLENTCGTFPVVVASAGDVNGDGYADLVVGKSREGNSRQGVVYTFFGAASGIATAPSLTLTGTDGQDEAFGFAVGSAGDVDGDGFGDLVVGASSLYVDSSSVTDTNTIGAAHIFRGGASGLASTAATSLAGPPGRRINFGVSVFGATN